jgi:hypothetical protein
VIVSVPRRPALWASTDEARRGLKGRWRGARSDRPPTGFAGIGSRGARIRANVAVSIHGTRGVSAGWSDGAFWDV